VSRVLFVTLLMVLMPLSGCFSSDSETITVEDTDEGEKDEKNAVIDGKPQLVLWNSSMLWNGSQPIIRGAVFDEDISNLTITYELLDSQTFERISGPYIVIANSDGTFSFNSPFVNPGSWIVKVNANDGNQSTEMIAEIQIIAPDEAVAEISFVWIQPAADSNIGSLIGNVNHNFLETCIVGYDPIGSATIMLANFNYSTGSMELEINTDEVLLEGDIIAACGKFNNTEKIIHVILEHDSNKIDSDGDGIEDEEDLCDSTPEGEAVYSDGCSDSERDSDNDGVSDAEDQCPDTPIGEQPDVQGCSDSQKDSDSDGVNDAEDQCPNTTEGTLVDTVGCEIITWGVEDTWVCQDGGIGPVYDLNEQYGYQANSNDPFTCTTVVTIDEAGGEIQVAANGIPNHDFTSTKGCCTNEEDYDWIFPITAVEDSDGSYESGPARGAVAVAVNGVPMFGPEDGPGGDAVALHHKYYHEDRQQIDLGICGGHSAGSTYHYHWDANCILWQPGDGEDISDYDWTKINSSIHSGIIGWSFDGYPIYGLYGWNEVADVVQVKSSYQLKASGQDGYDGTDDWEYIEGLGDLDECNGMFGPTPEYPDGIYHYVSTPISGSSNTHVDTDGSTVEMIGFPYFLMCYHGEATGGPKGGNSQPPPPGIVHPSGILAGIDSLSESWISQHIRQISGAILILIALAVGLLRKRQPET